MTEADGILLADAVLIGVCVLPKSADCTLISCFIFPLFLQREGGFPPSQTELVDAQFTTPFFR